MLGYGKLRKIEYGGNPFAGAIVGGYAGARRRPRGYGYPRARIVNYGRPIRPIRVRGAVARAARQMLNTRSAGFLGIETKFYDTAKAPTSVASVAALTGGEYDPALPAGADCMSTPAVGDTEQSRDGKKCILKNVQIKGMLNRGETESATDAPKDITVMVALVLDTQTNAATLNSEDVYKNLSADVLGAATPTRNLLFASCFRVLKTDTFCLTPPFANEGAVNLFATAAKQVPFEWFVDLKNLPVNFNAGTTAVIANVIDNSLHLIAFATAAGATITYNARVRFQG